MYSTLSFSLTLLGVFSIFENIKGNQKFSVLKYYMILNLVCLSFVSFMDFLNYSGYEIPYYKSIFKIVGAILVFNMILLIILKKIPKLIYLFEAVYLIFFLIVLTQGFQFIDIRNEIVINKYTVINKFFGIASFLIFFYFLIYCSIQLYKKRYTRNLYEKKMLNWVGSFIISLILIAILQFVLFILIINGASTFLKDSILTSFFIRTSVLLFILFRPRFLDDDTIGVSFNDLYVKSNDVKFEDFEFLFYKNHYYLNMNANLDDFALKLNHDKEVVLGFIKTQLDQNFTELLNQNRVEYLKQLLRSKKYESFTIEALSEMSGFGTRRSMYNYFNKYVGMTPSEFINSIN